MPPTKSSPATLRRHALLVAGAAVAALGLGTHFLAAGDAAGLLADALYTVLVYLVAAALLPKARRAKVAAGALAVSAAVELSQLTGIPARLAEAIPPARLLFGTTFSAPDLAAYALGAAVVLAADAAVSARARTWGRSQPE